MVTTLTIFVPKFATQKLVFCSGQIYYELLAEREKREITDVALVRIEQIAPFAFDRVAESAAKYCNAEVIWAQQEPK
jgi:2-oxoglutarate dehydrogenase E1 component